MYAAKIYNRQGNARVAAGFKRTFSRAAPVHFIGVWDTVASLVLDEGKRWTNARLNPEITFAYHALAIDERRKDFRPCLWDARNTRTGQTLEQVWFAGVHSDVGGLSSAARPCQYLPALDARQGGDGANGGGPAPAREQTLPARPARRVAGIVQGILAVPAASTSGRFARNPRSTPASGSAAAELSNHYAPDNLPDRASVVVVD